MEQYRSAINDLFKLSLKVSSFSQIENWLFNYENLYNQSDKEMLLHFAYYTEKEKTKGFFVNTYKAFEDLAKIHSLENYLFQELEYFNKIRNNKNELKSWSLRNEKIYFDNLVCFICDYLDYSDAPYHINVYIHRYSKYEILVDRNDFKSIIRFKDIFEDLFWNKKILPESIKRFNKVIEANIKEQNSTKVRLL